jgi:hypothetical protein
LEKKKEKREKEKGKQAPCTRVSTSLCSISECSILITPGRGYQDPPHFRVLRSYHLRLCFVFSVLYIHLCITHVCIIAISVSTPKALFDQHKIAEGRPRMSSIPWPLQRVPSCALRAVEKYKI